MTRSRGAQQASAQAARARTSYAAVKAPVAGTLIARNVEVGDVVQPGKVLMTLSPQGRTQLVVAIDEKNLALLVLGQQALVSADAYPAQRFAATLAWLDTEPAQVGRKDGVRRGSRGVQARGPAGARRRSAHSSAAGPRRGTPRPACRTSPRPGTGR